MKKNYMLMVHVRFNGLAWSKGPWCFKIIKGLTLNKLTRSTVTIYNVGPP